jgi:glycosyltransferase involved in cell wall biosynthesis
MVLHSIYFLEYMDKHNYDPATGEAKRTGLLRRAIAAALKRLDGAVLKRAEGIVVLSDFTRRLVQRHYPERLAKVTTSHGGADLDAFRPDPSRAEARTALNLPEDVPIFFSCRRIEHRMGVSELVEACHLLKVEGRRFLALVAGKGALEAAVRARIEKLALRDSVRLLGYVPEKDLRLHYRAADCFVLPTRALEGFGLVTAEALACGTPVIGTPVGATPEILGPLDPRLLAADCSPDGIAAAMARFLDELLGEEDLPQRCRAYAEANLSWEPMTDTVEHLLGEMAAD